MAEDQRPGGDPRNSPPFAEAAIFPRERTSLHSGTEEKSQLFVHQPDVEGQARDILGLNDLETLPTALAARAEQLWRTDRFAANVPFTNPMFIPMGSSPDMGLLYETVATVVRRHEALRTRLAVRGGRAIQIVEDWNVTSIELVDVLQSEIDEDRPGRNSQVSEFTQRSMDLYVQGNFQCQAFRDENGIVRLGIIAHGFFSDAWSSQILLRDIRTVHSALKNREAAILKPAAQYTEYAQAQRRSLARDLTAHLTHWHRKLKDMPPARLPYNHCKEGGRRGRSYFFMDEDIAARLTAISADARISLTLVLLAAYQLSLARWSGQDEILSAAYTADRLKPRFQDTVGFLVTNMPVRSRIDRNVTFRSFLHDFAREFYDGYTHRELSCELYDAIFAPEKPFCATVFNFVPLQRNFFTSELHSIPAFKGTIVAPDASRPAIYREVYLGLTQYPNGLLGKVFYNADRFTPEGMEVFIRHFSNVIQLVTTDPGMNLGELLDDTC
jgi:hypothetical protein